MALTRLAREVLQLAECVPVVELCSSQWGRWFLASPMIGKKPGVEFRDYHWCTNYHRGLSKLHDYDADWNNSLSNPLDLLRIATAKAILRSIENTASKMLVEKRSRRVYGIHFGGNSPELLDLADMVFFRAGSRQAP